jgi:hypothetical protein
MARIESPDDDRLAPEEALVAAIVRQAVKDLRSPELHGVYTEYVSESVTSNARVK